jgi:hypothetical protein
MDNTEVKALLSPEDEMIMLSKRQAKLQQDIAEAKAAKAQKQMMAISDAARARKEAEAQERLVLEEIKARRLQREKEAQAEADAIMAADRKVAEERMAQQLLEKRARIAAEELAQHLKEETEKAFRLERELELQLLTLNDDTVVAEDVQQQSAIPSPLARILFPDCSTNAQTTVYEGLTSEENAKLVAKRDIVNNLLEFGKSKIQTPADMPAPTPEPVPVWTARRAKRFVDIGTSRELETLLIKELKLSIPGMKLDELSATFHYAPLMAAARVAIAEFKAKPMSADGLVFRIEQLADSEQIVGG